MKSSKAEVKVEAKYLQKEKNSQGRSSRRSPIKEKKNPRSEVLQKKKKSYKKKFQSPGRKKKRKEREEGNERNGNLQKKSKVVKSEVYIFKKNKQKKYEAKTTEEIKKNFQSGYLVFHYPKSRPTKKKSKPNRKDLQVRS